MKPDDGACRRRRAAFELRSHAAHLLDQAHRLDGLPAARLLRSDAERIAEAIGVDPELLDRHPCAHGQVRGPLLPKRRWHANRRARRPVTAILSPQRFAGRAAAH